MNTEAIAMWDFSWIERRWPGAGYENPDVVLDELCERGYSLVRIDAFPHLISADAEKQWVLKPVWSVQDWGSPSKNIVQIQPALNQFIKKCSRRKIKVALSSWYREDTDNVRLLIKNPKIMAIQWIKTLQSIERDNLLDDILFVDLCNEWPHPLWAPFFQNTPENLGEEGWYTDVSMQWMQESAGIIKEAYPTLPLTFSFKANQYLKTRDLSFLDLLEPHIWMAKCNNHEFNRKMEYDFPLFSNKGYENIVEHAESLYNAGKSYWQQLLSDEITKTGNIAREINQPLVTTECWALVDFKDWPMLNWEWIKELCETGVKAAVSARAWQAIATSNFCGPQFSGMWRDIKWHQKLTSLIRQDI